MQGEEWRGDRTCCLEKEPGSLHSETMGKDAEGEKGEGSPTSDLCVCLSLILGWKTEWQSSESSGKRRRHTSRLQNDRRFFKKKQDMVFLCAVT